MRHIAYWQTVKLIENDKRKTVNKNKLVEIPIGGIYLSAS